MAATARTWTDEQDDAAYDVFVKLAEWYGRDPAKAAVCMRAVMAADDAVGFGEIDVDAWFDRYDEERSS